MFPIYQGQGKQGELNFWVLKRAEPSGLGVFSQLYLLPGLDYIHIPPGHGRADA